VKVQLLYLDSHDDQVSVRDKMGWVKAPRLLVVWPRRGRVLTQRLDLALIKRQAERRGAQLGLVTFDPDVRDHAQDMGIPVFDSVDSTPEAIWREAQAKAQPFERLALDRERLARAEPGLSGGRRGTSRWGVVQRWAAFIIGLAALASLAAALGPSATVIITPRTQIQHTKFKIQLDPEADTLTANNHVPARRHSLTVSGEARVPTSGTVSVPSSPAEGSVVFTNLGQDSITLPKGTGVRADAPGQPRFTTLASVTLEGGQGSTASVDVRAADDGSAGNVPAEAIGSIEGPLGLQVAVTNPEPTQGGADTTKPAVASADLRQLDTRLQSQLMEQAAGEFPGQLADGEALAPDSLKISQTLESAYDAQVGDIAASVGLQLKLEFSGLVYHPQTVTAAVVRALDAQRPAGKSPVPGTVRQTLTLVEGQPDTLQISASETIYNDIPRQELGRSLVGQMPDAVEALVDSRYPGSQVDLVLRPAWLPRLPWLPTRIDVMAPWDRR
jgi:hypothetical protein